MKLDLEIIDKLPFVKLKVSYKGKIAILNDVLVDTGSGSCILKNEAIQELGIKPHSSSFRANEMRPGIQGKIAIKHFHATCH